MNRTATDLQMLMALPLEVKVVKAKNLIREFLENEDAYISYSGGIDSEVMFHLVRSVDENVPAIFLNTGQENKHNLTIAREKRDKGDCKEGRLEFISPIISFEQVIEQYGYPVISKEQSQYIYEYRRTDSQKLRNLRYYGRIDKPGARISKKYRHLIDAPFNISHMCCKKLKKDPAMKYEKETGRRPFIGTRADESFLRRTGWLQTGCNSYKERRSVSRPLSIFKRDDIWAYIKKYNLNYSKAYSGSFACDRTGCSGCLFGIQHEGKDGSLNRFQKLRITEPRRYSYYMNQLGYRKVLSYLSVPYE